MIQFENGIGRDYTLLEFSSNSGLCRIPHAEKELYSFTLSLYLAGKKMNVVCYDTVEDPGNSGYPSHKLHRIVTE